MPFNNLVLDALLDDMTAYEENGVGVSIKKDRGETILFFEVDDANNPCSSLKTSHNIKNICDLIIYYSKGNVKKQRQRKRPVLCFLELKGSRFIDALDQTISTCERVKKKVVGKVEYKICIISRHGSAPSVGKDPNLKNKLKKCVGDVKKNYFQRTGVNGKIDIKPFLLSNNN